MSRAVTAQTAFTKRDLSDALLRRLGHWLTAGVYPCASAEMACCQTAPGRTTKETCNGNRLPWGIVVFNER